MMMIQSAATKIFRESQLFEIRILYKAVSQSTKTPV